MAIYENLIEFAGKPVLDWEPGLSLEEAAGAAYRLRLSHETAEEGTRWTDRFAAFLEDPASAEVTALVVGVWSPWGSIAESNSEPVVEALVAARDRLPALRALFLGDITSEECEISWIQQSDVSPLLAAFGELREFWTRGAEGLSFGSSLRHPHLKKLVVQSGGLPAAVVGQVVEADLPELEHLELWLGEDGYGGDATVEDLAPLFAGQPFPRLRTLGLRDSEITDQIAVAIAQAPLLWRIRVLDLSLGTLGDQGAAALLASPAAARLERLDVHHHFCSDEMVAKLERLGEDAGQPALALPGTEHPSHRVVVDASERQEPYDGDPDGRYVAVSE